MGKPYLTDEEFIALFKKLGAAEMARHLGIHERNIYARRKRLEGVIKESITSPNSGEYVSRYEKRLPLQIENGTIIIASDAHYWPNIVTCGHRGLVHITKELKPQYLIMNGDLIDGARISRHGRIGWAKSPTMKQEEQEVYDRLIELSKASEKTKLFWTLGNHDLRFETYLSNKAGDVEDMSGMTLAERFPFITICISIWINDNVVVKHRFKGGVHATHNNTVNAGKTMVTGHLHSLKVTPFSDYNGTRWGVDTGTLTTPSSDKAGDPQTEYNEDNPQNHRQGFVVLTFHEGKLLWPEIVRVVDEHHIDFRGKLIKV